MQQGSNQPLPPALQPMETRNKPQPMQPPTYQEHILPPTQPQHMQPPPHDHMQPPQPTRRTEAYPPQESYQTTYQDPQQDYAYTQEQVMQMQQDLLQRQQARRDLLQKERQLELELQAQAKANSVANKEMMTAAAAPAPESSSIYNFALEIAGLAALAAVTVPLLLQALAGHLPFEATGLKLQLITAIVVFAAVFGGVMLRKPSA